MKFQKLLFAAMIVVLAGPLMQVGSAKADGPEGTPANGFATNCQ